MTIKAQGCKFKRTKNSDWEMGLAIVKDWNLCDINIIIDENHTVIKEPYDYMLSLMWGGLLEVRDW